MHDAPYPADLPYSATYYKLAQTLIRTLFTVLTRFEVTGIEHMPSGGPLIIATNHLHALDPAAVFAFLPFRAATLVASKYEHTLRGRLIRPLGAIFVKRGEVDRRALRTSLAVLKGGGVLGVSPEGTRSKTGGLQEGKRGVAYLAYLTQAPILPVALSGVEKALGSLARLRRARVTVTIGELIHLPPVEGGPRNQDLEVATALVMSRLAGLLPSGYRGVYAQPPQVDD